MPVPKKIPAAKKRKVEFINNEQMDSNDGNEEVPRRNVRQTKRPFRFQDYLDDCMEGEEEDNP